MKTDPSAPSTPTLPTDDFHAQLQAGIPDILAYLRTVAGCFGLGFQADDYHYLSLTPREKVLLDYLAGCPGLPHSKWGDDDELRRQNVRAFVESADFLDYSAGLKSGGSVIASEVAGYLSECCSAHALPDWVKALSDSLADHPALKQEFFVVICLQQPTAAQLARIHGLLVHEWAHLLFFSNQVRFQTSAAAHPDAWLYDEGLATWIEYAYKTGGWKAGNWDGREPMERSLGILQDRGEPRSVTGYFEKGLWFNEHFTALPVADWPDELMTLAGRLP